MNAWKHILVFGALICLLGFASGAVVADDVDVEDIDIAGHLGIHITYESGSALVFDQGGNALPPDDPDATGTYYTQWAYVDIDCNHDLTIDLDVTPFTDGSFTLETDVQYNYRAYVGGAWNAWTSVGPVWMPPPYSRTWTYTHGGNFSGYFELDIRLSLHRKGTADHSGLYTSTITVTVT